MTICYNQFVFVEKPGYGISLLNDYTINDKFQLDMFCLITNKSNRSYIYKKKLLFILTLVKTRLHWDTHQCSKSWFIWKLFLSLNGRMQHNLIQNKSILMHLYHHKINMNKTIIFAMDIFFFSSWLVAVVCVTWEAN